MEPGVRLGRSLGGQSQRANLILMPLQMALAPVLATLGGWWLDRRFGWFPVLTLLGLCLGIATAVRSIVRAVRESQ
jgi:F0F1-type ATP synthase assembly protein I